MENTIVGRKLNDTYDFYETPKWATEKAVHQMVADGILNKEDVIYECCCGAGAIVDVLEAKGFEKVLSSDIQTGEYIKGDKGIDVYSIKDNSCDVVFTNPPYKEMTKGNMLQAFMRISRSRVILLLNVYYLAGKARKKLLENSHLMHVYIHSERVTMYPFGTEQPKNDGTKMFVWCVWDKAYNGMPVLSWI